MGSPLPAGVELRKTIMPITRFSCPSCEAALSTPKAHAPGTRITCPRCGERLRLPEADGEPAVLADEPAKITELTAKRSAADRPRPLDEDEEAPARKRARRAERDEDEDRDDQKAATRERRPARKKGSRDLVIGLVTCSLLLAGFGVGAYFLIPRGSATTETKVAEKPLELNPEPNPLPPQPNPTNPDAPPRPLQMADWMQDLEAAKQQAAQENKDLLILFNGSDWCPNCAQLAQNVLLTPDFRERADRLFVLVHIDFPRQPPAQAAVQDAARNKKLQQQFFVQGFPTLILADAEGRPYASDIGYNGQNLPSYLTRLEQLQERHQHRDQLLRAVATAQGPGQVEAAQRALEFLSRTGYLDHYLPQLESWTALARTHDPKNEQGLYERFFMAELLVRLDRARNQASALAACADRLDEWSKDCRAQNADRVPSLYLGLGMQLAQAGDRERALGCFKAGRAAGPRSPDLAAYLSRAASGRLPLGSGTGFAVADGYILTNHHVIEGPGQLMVQVAKRKDPLPAEVVAKDAKRDMALLRVQLPDGLRVQGMRVTGAKPVERGEEVMALGFPLYGALGAGLKQTTGRISGLPEPATNDMIVLDVRINPGNSGGPLLDACGNVVGMVTAKSGTGRTVDSYGLALPGAELDTFLLKHLPGHQTNPPATEKMEWKDIDRLVSPSVVTVLRML
jgi:S1-C subfamily serine protease